MPHEQHEKRVKEFHRYLDAVAWVAGIAAAIVAGVIMFTPVHAEAHDGHTVTNAQYGLPMTKIKPMGRMSAYPDGSGYLYGMNRTGIGTAFLSEINCCKYGGNGDCNLVPLENVSVVPGGYMWDGEFIPEAEATVSPDDNYYGCKHASAERAHCFFAPPQGF